MDIQQKKLELVKLIIETGESDLLDVVEMILKGKNKEVSPLPIRYWTHPII